ncbi:MAG: bifunctional homocysteine S-methyltransferase/methylenetetrahydrofolate reductase [Chloroflexota bacterium]|jgi:homocysteine S-methyltransferase|nr:bifunctional homocysteine S-methyltransferase/methylenetetrahydrofolate reductase [Chloroflexota bacterium]
MAHPFATELLKRPLLFDGAMGTMLYEAGRSLDECLDALNLSHPDIVSAVYRAYINAGADVIETNTFGANRIRLGQHGFADKVRDIAFRGVKLAREEREISGKSVMIAGSIGPTGRTIAPIGTLTAQHARDAFTEQIEALLEAGVDLLVMETMGSLDEMAAALDAAGACTDLPIVSLMTFAEDGRTLSGHDPREVVATLAERNVAAIGANCSVGPQRLLRVIDHMHAATRDLDDPPALAAIPNAGWPTIIGSRLIYRSSPEYFATFATDAISRGARIVGGCCGTTSEHIAAMRVAIDTSEPTANGRGNTHSAGVHIRPVAPRQPIDVESDAPTSIKQMLSKKFLRCVEIDPPKGFNPQKALDGARLLKDAGVDAINVADSPMARVRMSAMTLCYLIQHEVDVETIIHFTTRDRSLMGLQSELLGAHAANVRNILALTGDPPNLGDYPESTAVYDVDSIGLIRIISRLNQGEDSFGASIGRGASFTIACAIDPTRQDLEEEARRLHDKIESGADFVMTQPIFDIDVWTRFLKIYGEAKLPVPVMIGVLPLQSSRHAEFLHNEVPGITLTDKARDRMRQAGSSGRQEGVQMAQELLRELVPFADGTYLMPSFGRYEVAAEVISVLDEEPTISR